MEIIEIIFELFMVVFGENNGSYKLLVELNSPVIDFKSFNIIMYWKNDKLVHLPKLQ